MKPRGKNHEMMVWIEGKRSIMEEVAKEELELLEAQYPNHHHHLKYELKSFICELQNKHLDSQLFVQNNHLVFFDTEESSSLEGQRKSSKCGLEVALADGVVMEGEICGSSELETPKADVIKHSSSRKKKRKDRVDLVLERAQVCLKKIKHLKVGEETCKKSRIE